MKMKGIVRSLVAIVLLVSAPFAYGMPFDGLMKVPPAVRGPLSESATLAFVGVAMLVVARRARRRSTEDSSHPA